MPKFVIERDMPNVGSLTPEQLTAASQTSCKVLRELGPSIQWIQSYVTPQQDVLHLQRPQRGDHPPPRPLRPASLPNSISPVKTIIDPTTAEG